MRTTVTVPTPASRRAFLTVLGLSAAAVGCGRATATGGSRGAAQTKKLRYQGSVGQVTLPELAEDLGYFGDVKLEWVGNTISGPQDIQSAATGQTDSAAPSTARWSNSPRARPRSRRSSATTASTRTRTAATTCEPTARCEGPGTWPARRSA
ncbi:hypothetical protein ACM614_09495 [Streptomyces sp. 12297]